MNIEANSAHHNKEGILQVNLKLDNELAGAEM
jgi:hypothetical protein